MTSPLEKISQLEALEFGQRVAEEEPRLENYFVETLLWRKFLRGEVDIVYGMKGAGKSAIFHLLSIGRNIPSGVKIIPAENPRGTPIFNAIKIDPPPTEAQFIYLWKLYVLSLIASGPEILEILKQEQPELVRELNSVGIIGGDKNEILKKALRYVGSVKIPNVVEVGLKAPEEEAQRINTDSVIDSLNNILARKGRTAWIMFDRLDTVFDDDANLEENALRALFKTYRDLARHDHIRLKIFLRTDIWRALTKKGFREASHITQSATIEWSEANIVNLVVRRILSNSRLVEFYGVDPKRVLENYEEQKQLFYRIFPSQIDPGSRKSETIRWLIARVTDGTQQVAPRELVHLLNEAKDEQIKSLELGESIPEGELLFSPASLKRALPEVSRVRLEQTIFAEYPDMKSWILKLEGEKATQTNETLQKIWNLSVEETGKVVSTLAEIGFFEVRGDKNNPQYRVPFLYRPRLNLTQGKAGEDECGE